MRLGGTRGCRAGLGVALAALSLGMLTGAAAACTPEEYMTPEERASGQYDTTPAPWETGGAPHDHGAPVPGAGAAPPSEGGASTDAPAAGAPAAGAPARRQRRGTGRASPQRTRGERPQPARPGRAYVRPTHSHGARATLPVRLQAGAAPAARPASRVRSVGAGRARAARDRAAAARPAHPAAARPRPSLTAAGELRAAPGFRVPADMLITLALLAGGLAGGALARRGRTAPSLPEALAAPDAIEAELQEMLAEHHARAAEPPAETGDRARAVAR